MHLPLGTLLQGGKYKIERYIGNGGFGCTYEARHVMLNNTVAIKEFFVKDYCNREATTNRIYVATQSKVEIIERLRKKFVEEARAIFGMSHPNIVRVTDIFEENGTVYYVMDYINGSSLASVIEKHGVLGEAEAMDYIKQIASALAYVHSHNRLHLDVKPQNIMIDQSGKAVLIDFGVSKQYDEVNGENTSTLLGCTPGYAPIEQIGNGVVRFYPSADIYALGATLYKALTGVTPVAANLRASGEELPLMPADISRPTRIAVEAAMQINKAHRPQSVAEFLSLLESTDNSEQSTDNREQGEELIDDADVEVTVLPEYREQRTDKRVQSTDNRELRTDNRVQRVNAKAIETESEETRAVEKETEKVAVTNNEPAEPKKNRTAWVVAVVVLLGILVGGGLFFAFSGGDSDNGSSNGGNERLAAHSNEPATTVVIEDTEEEAETPIIPAPPVVNTDSIVAARMQAYQDSINAANAAREAEATRLAEQQAREEVARREREEQARREREEAERLAREQQQGISTQKKVDLGLSVCWAGWNVGASSPEGCGNYYAWGETTAKSSYTESSYQYHNGSYVNIGSNICGTQYDVARTQWGGSWRMPTKAEFQELKDRCTWTFTSYKGINGYKVTGPNGNSIFLPAAGYRYGTVLDYRGAHGHYWSGSLYEGSQAGAYYLFFICGDRLVNYYYRESGYTVRPVCDK